MDKRQFLTKSLQSRARFYAHVIVKLYGRERLAAKVTDLSRGARFLTLGVRLADPTYLDRALKLSEPIALAAHSKAVLAQRDLGVVRYQFQLSTDLWQSYTRADVEGLTLGLGENRKPVEFGFTPPHCLIAGTTDSGKTEAVKSALIALLNAYTPPDLGLLIVDPHSDYSDFDNASHLIAPIARTPDDIAAVLTLAGDKLARRKAESIKDARRLVLVIDEAETTLSNEVHLAIVQRWGTEGRKFRCNLIVSTQKPTQKTLPNLVYLLNNRFIGLVDNAQTSAHLTGQAGLECHKLTGQGDFTHVTGGLVADRFQVAMATPADFERLERAEPLSLPGQVEPSRALNIPLPSQDAGGRPPLQVEPETAAIYWRYGPGNISRAKAKELWGLTRTAHELHKDFVLRMGQAYLSLRKGGAL